MAVHLAHQLRNLGRYRQILVVLVRHGFADFVRHTGLAAIVSRSMGTLGKRGRAEASLIALPREARLRRALEELGPTFIKLGQILSTRRDLVPDEMAAEFAKLQSECPAIPFEAVQEQLQAEYGDQLDTLFQSIEEKPLAAASMAQAHRAVLADGSEVVLKVLRPGIEEVLAADMEILRFIAGVVEDYFQDVGFDPVAVADEFARELQREVDLLQEARSTENLRNAFLDDPGISFPAVHWIACTKRILCIDEVHGTLLTEIVKDPESISTEARQAIVENGARAVSA